jgi:hypothetical protein
MGMAYRKLADIGILASIISVQNWTKDFITLFWHQIGYSMLMFYHFMIKQSWYHDITTG